MDAPCLSPTQRPTVPPVEEPVQRLIFSAVLLGCAQEAPRQPAPAVVLGGCAGVRPGPVCAGPDQAVAWVPLGPGERIVQPAGAGPRVALPAQGSVIIEVSGRESVTVRLEAAPERPLHAAGRQAHREGQDQQAVATLAQAAGAQAAAGDTSGAALSAQLQAFIEQKRGRLEAARQALATHVPPEADGASRAMHAYFQALVARAGGDARGALRAFDEAALWAERLGLPLGATITEERAMTWLTLGRVGEAVATLKGLAEGEVPVCKRAYLLANLGWALLASPEAARAETGAVLARVEQDQAACEHTTPDMRANARLNRALWALRAGRLDEAGTLIAQPAEGVRPDVRAWTAYVRAALVSDSIARAAALDQVAQVAGGVGFEDLRWRALVDAGIALGTDAGAIERFAAAEALVAARAFDIPVDAGRVAFTTDRRESAARLVAALVAAGRPAEALDAARRARRRVMTSLPTDQLIAGLDAPRRAEWEAALQRYRAAHAALAEDAAQDWERSGAALAQAQQARAQQVAALRDLLDQAVARLGRPATEGALRGPQPGEIILLWAQGVEGAWHVFAQDTQGTLALPVVPPAWTAPVLDRVGAAQRVRVLAVGPVADARLELAGRPAVHALDLPPRPQRTRGGRVVLVADPTGDLPGARREADGVAGWLAGRQLTRLTGSAVTRAALSEALTTADLLHYAGHGRYAGFEGWESALPVHDGALGVADLLLLPRVPAAVVLSGCETGRAEGAGLGLAHTLLVRGAEEVVAPVTPVDDTVAATFADHLYRALGAGDRLEDAFQAVAGNSASKDHRLFVP